jgi:1-pyrroline-5-carboxylate dehydrogenase
MATKYRPYMNGTTMLGQSKNAFQAEIDSACELIDFLRFNVHFLSEIYKQQPISGPVCTIVWSTVRLKVLYWRLRLSILQLLVATYSHPPPCVQCGSGPANTQVYSAQMTMRI